MNILFDNQIFYSQRFGGISRYFAELADGLCRSDKCHVSVLAPFHSNEYLRDCACPDISAPYFNYKFRGAGRLKNIGRKLLLPMQRIFMPTADIVHETYYSMMPLEQGKARVVTVYDMIHELFADEYKNDLVTSKAKIAAIKRADHVICISKSTQRDLINFLAIDPKNTSVIYLGHTLKFNDSCIESNIIVAKRPFLLYVGNRGGYKNFLGFCESVASSHFLRNNFDIVAFGGGNLESIELNHLDKMGLIDQVFHVYGDDKLLSKYYRSAALFVYPSKYEGFGIPPLEAMNFDCPVACSATSSIPEVVGSAGIYFDPYSIDSMREAIESVIGDSLLRNSLVANGRERLNRFSWASCVNETSELYNSLIGKSHG